MIPADLAARLRMLTEASFFDSEPPVQGVAKTREIQARLPQLLPGQQFTATINRPLPDGTFQAVVAGRNITLALNNTAQAGDTLDLVVTRTAQKTVFAQLANPQSATTEPGSRPSLSPTAQLISALLTGQTSQRPVSLAGGQPLLPAPPTPTLPPITPGQVALAPSPAPGTQAGVAPQAALAQAASQTATQPVSNLVNVSSAATPAGANSANTAPAAAPANPAAAAPGAVASPATAAAATVAANAAAVVGAGATAATAAAGTMAAASASAPQASVPGAVAPAVATATSAPPHAQTTSSATTASAGAATVAAQAAAPVAKPAIGVQAQAVSAAIAAARSVLTTMLTAAPLATALRQAVSQSGLFYESHQLQWLSGKVDTAALSREPQAAFAQPRPTGGGGSPSAAGSPSSSAASSAASNSQGQAASGALARVGANAAAITGISESAEADGGSERIAEALRNATAARLPTVPERLMPLVQQQLDGMATQQYVLHGQAWPGQFFEWILEDADQDGQAEDADEKRAWKTTLKLSMPDLGAVEARVILNPSGVAIRLFAQTDESAQRLDQGQPLLESALEAAGLPLMGFVVERPQRE